MQITKKALRAYEYYEKIMMEIQKYPSKTAFDFSKSKGKYEILLYIKCAKTKKKKNSSFKGYFFFRRDWYKHYLTLQINL
jgi:hypothetical protein